MLLSYSVKLIVLSFNSVMYASISANDYIIVAVNNAFTQPGPANLTSLDSTMATMTNQSPITSIRDTALAGSLQYLTKTECINDYAQDYLSARSNLLLVLSTSSNNASTATALGAWEISNLYLSVDDGCPRDAYPWICGNSCGVPCEFRLQAVLDNVNDWQPYGMDVDHCLSQTTEERCKLQFSLYLIIVVIIFNLFKATLMCYLAFGLTESPIMTIGDAISSFLTDADKTTKGCCLYSKHEFETSVDSIDAPTSAWLPRAKQWTTDRKLWYNASSTGRWTVFFLLYVSHHCSKSFSNPPTDTLWLSLLVLPC